MILLSIQSVQYLTFYKVEITFASLLFSHIADSNIFLFPVTYAFLIVFGDIQTVNENRKHADLRSTLGVAMILSLLLFLCTLFGFVFSLLEGSSYRIISNSVEISSMIWGFALLFGRLVFSISLVKLINLKFYPYGFISILIMSIIDSSALRFLHGKILGLIPFTHTSPFYVSGAIPDFGARLSISFSIGYWIILFFLAKFFQGIISAEH